MHVSKKISVESKLFVRLIPIANGGIGRKPLTVVSMYDQEQLVTQEPPQSQLEMLQTILKDPACSTTLEEWFHSLPPPYNNEGNDGNDEDE
ncbi:unnamed protein product [Lactuca virosa]|uniref:Uncharacterized protein n=1 Tax=Lactuca virosa TaxID=75947 RepID=A0AAU9M4Q1_9ASTR|nr:unnamed protein product [Lactuca virosa]